MINSTKPEASLHTREMYTLASAAVNLMNPLEFYMEQQDHVRAYFRWKCPMCCINDDDLRGCLELFKRGERLFEAIYEHSCEHKPEPHIRRDIRELNYLIMKYKMKPLPEDKQNAVTVARNAGQYRSNADVCLNKKAR